MVATEEMMTVPEMAERLRVPTQRAYRLLDEVGIPYVRVSERRIRIPRGAFEEWLTARTFRAERHSETPSL